MRQLFLRLTITFWLLFLSLVASIAISFYFEYEQNFSQKLVSIDQNTSNIGEKVSADLERITELYNVFLSVIENNHNQAKVFYNNLLDGELERLVGDFEGESNSREEKIEELVHRNFANELDNYFFHFVNAAEIAQFSFLPIDEFDSFVQKGDLENVGYDRDEVMLLYLDQLDEYDEGSYRFFILRAIVLGEKLIGHLVAELTTTAQFLFHETNTIYYMGENVYIPCCEHFTNEQRIQLTSTSFEEGIDFFNSQGYHTSMYISETHDFRILHYTSLRQIHLEVLRETLTVFKISVVLSVILFAIGFYLLFKSVIKPCYLLVDYVGRCGDRDYLLPANISEKWRATFLTVREAYLENERLLAEKDHQSEELQVAWKRAIDASQAKTHFLAKVSHELKTPLNAIKGYTQLLKLGLKEGKQKKQIDIIDHSSELLLNLVNELLDFSVIEEGRVKLKIDEINLFSIANEIEELFVIQANAKNLDFFVEADEDIPTTLLGDGDRIKQVIINLVSNGIKFTHSGYIIVNIELDYETETDAFISIKVKDTGKGIEESKFPTIFESFTQENNSISRHYGGTGLGLSISKQLAETMGGNLTLESEVNKGTTFTFFLPLEKKVIKEETH